MNIDEVKVIKRLFWNNSPKLKKPFMKKRRRLNVQTAISAVMKCPFWRSNCAKSGIFIHLNIARKAISNLKGLHDQYS